MSASNMAVGSPSTEERSSSLSDSSSASTKIYKQIDKQSFEYIIRSGFAGGVAGSAAKTLIAPLDRVKILFQTSNPHYKHLAGSFKGLFNAMGLIYSKDGLSGLYQGHSATLLRVFPYAAIKFVCYEQIRTILIPRDEYETPGRRFLAGSLSGVMSVFFTYPLDLVRVRLAYETSHSHINYGRGKIYHIFKTIYNEQPRLSFNTGFQVHDETFIIRFLYNKFGSNIHFIQAVSNFYRGFIPTIIGMIPYAGVSFYSHDLFHDIFRSPSLSQYTINHEYDHLKSHESRTKSDSSFDRRKPLYTWAQLLAGGGAGMLAQAAAYPFEVIRRRMQVGGVVNSGGQFFSIAYTTAMIYSEKGLRGFYVGLGIGFIKIVPMFACSFYVYERLKHFLQI